MQEAEEEEQKRVLGLNGWQLSSGGLLQKSSPLKLDIIWADLIRVTDKAISTTTNRAKKLGFGGIRFKVLP